MIFGRPQYTPHPRVPHKYTLNDGEGWYCRCGRRQDLDLIKRNRNNAKRGKRIQRERIVALGGRNLGGNIENLDGIGVLFRYESKSGGSFPERAWRWLKGIPHNAGEIQVLIITDAPGSAYKARSVVVVDYTDWRALHEETASEGVE